MLKPLIGVALISIGIAAGSMALFANLLTPPDMADWAWSLVGPWQEWTSEFWFWFAARLGLALQSSFVAPLNVAAALLFTAIGVRARDHRQRSVKVLRHPFIQLFGAMVAVFAIGYVLLAGPIAVKRYRRRREQCSAVDLSRRCCQQFLARARRSRQPDKAPLAPAGGACHTLRAE